MKSPLLPHKYKRIGWLILIPSAIVGIVVMITGFEFFPGPVKVPAIIYEGLYGDKTALFSFIETDTTYTIIGVFFLTGAMLTAFSKEKIEDEFIEKTRLSSLLWAVCANYIMLFASFTMVYGAAFLKIMIYNMFTILIIFIARFNFMLYLNGKTLLHEK